MWTMPEPSPTINVERIAADLNALLAERNYLRTDRDALLSERDRLREQAMTDRHERNRIEERVQRVLSHRDTLYAQLVKRDAAIAWVRELHQPEEVEVIESDGPQTYVICASCGGARWDDEGRGDCPTIQALASVQPAVSRGALDIVAERRRQVEDLGYTAEHDMEHDPMALAQAAAAYLGYGRSPWVDPDARSDRRRDLVRAGGLIAAAIDRHDAGEAPAATRDDRPHSRACGIRRHDHGPDCDSSCPTCIAAEPSKARRWLDRHGDIWTEGNDGLMHSPETRPFPREHVEKKWGPLALLVGGEQ